MKKILKKKDNVFYFFDNPQKGFSIYLETHTKKIIIIPTIEITNDTDFLHFFAIEFNFLFWGIVFFKSKN